MTQNIDPRLNDLVLGLQRRVESVYPDFRAGDAIGRTRLSLKVLKEAGLSEQRTSDGGWQETKTLVDDFDHATRFLTQALPLRTVKVLEAFIGDRVLEQFVIGRGDDGATEDEIAVYLQGDDISYEDAFRRAFRLFYLGQVGLVATLWQLKDEGVIDRKDGPNGSIWAPTPYDFFSKPTTTDKRQAGVFRALERRSLVKATSKKSWRVTSEGINQGLLSKTGHVCDLLEHLGNEAQGSAN